MIELVGGTTSAGLLFGGSGRRGFVVVVVLAKDFVAYFFSQNVRESQIELVSIFIEK